MNDHDAIVTLGIKVESQSQDIKDLEAKVDDLTQSLTKYKGIIGGIMLVISLIGAGLTLFLNYLRVKV